MEELINKWKEYKEWQDKEVELCVKNNERIPKVILETSFVGFMDYLSYQDND